MSWGQFGRTSAGTGDNPLETRLTPQTVSNLRRVWHRSLGAPEVAGSPVEWNGIVYVAGQRIHAYGAGLGRQRWQGGHGGLLAAARGILYAVRDVHVPGSSLVRLHVWAYDATSGRLRWTVKAPVPASVGIGYGNPTVSGGTVYVELAFQVKASGPLAGRVLAFNARSGALRWTAKHGGVSEKPVVANHRVYTVQAEGLGAHIFVLSASTGRVESEVGGAEDLMAVGPVRLFEAGQGEVVAAYPMRGCRSFTCKALWSRSVGRAYGLALSPTALYVADLGSGGGTAGELLSLRVGTGAVRWHAAPPGDDGGFTSVSVAGKVVYATTPYHVLAYPAACETPCQPIWESPTRSYPTWVRGPAIIANGELVYTSGQANGPVAYRLPADVAPRGEKAPGVSGTQSSPSHGRVGNVGARPSGRFDSL